MSIVLPQSPTLFEQFLIKYASELTMTKEYKANDPDAVGQLIMRHFPDITLPDNWVSMVDTRLATPVKLSLINFFTLFLEDVFPDLTLVQDMTDDEIWYHMNRVCVDKMVTVAYPDETTCKEIRECCHRLLLQQYYQSTNQHNYSQQFEQSMSCDQLQRQVNLLIEDSILKQQEIKRTNWLQRFTKKFVSGQCCWFSEKTVCNEPVSQTNSTLRNSLLCSKHRHLEVQKEKYKNQFTQGSRFKYILDREKQ